MNLLLLGIHDLAQYESCGDRKDDVADEFFISRALLGGDDSVADDVRAPDCVWERERDPNLSEAFHTSLSCLEIINISSLQLEADTMLLRTKESLINWKILEIALQQLELEPADSADKFLFYKLFTFAKDITSWEAGQNHFVWMRWTLPN